MTCIPLHRGDRRDVPGVAARGLDQRLLAQPVETAGPPEMAGEVAVLDEARQRPLADPGRGGSRLGQRLIDRRDEAAGQDEVAQAEGGQQRLEKLPT
ncbi:hypothetical protein ACU4GA_20320 [Methylobacterium oryzae CBMB20]